MNNPNARLTEHDLLGTLAATRTEHRWWEYSNFAMNGAVLRATRSGMGFETLLSERLLQPLGMSDTYITQVLAEKATARRLELLEQLHALIDKLIS